MTKNLVIALLSGVILTQFTLAGWEYTDSYKLQEIKETLDKIHTDLYNINHTLQYGKR